MLACQLKLKIMKNNLLYSDLEKIKIQNYACQGCPNCSTLAAIDLRTRQGIFTYLIQKRSCYLSRLTSKIALLHTKAEKVRGEIKSYQAALNQENHEN